ncbi:hypothetical protein N657DRAFT_644230 [Parathielavia appendiculata]|uniref:BTB domain transcription factor n=1 Tax=Parathielavia appendiculata TaxID=2587402 RepID=A0AAN6Z4W0_9PEZI|nr:hypothetical protein N657DRAFT_644230 [Parathielavia appendiculata]
MTTTTRSAAKKHEQPSGALSAAEAQPGSKHKTQESPAPRSPKRTKKTDEGSPASEEKRLKRAKESKEKEKKEDQEKGSMEERREKQQNGGGMEKTEARPKETATSAVEPQGRDDTEQVPSSILEKGIIYFFFRPRVNVDSPSDVSDIARSHIILRPIEQDAKLGSGPIGDARNSRLCLLPKKTLPQSGRDRFTAFVEKSNVSFQTLKDEFLASGDYQTKTAGTRHTPAATPVGEGVYAITSTGRTSHLVYILTLPEKLGEVQKEIGLKERGSFVISTKNPEFPGPQNARLPKAPEYPKELFEEFRSLRWVPTQPKHLDYVNTQFLLVGESSGFEKALALQKEDQEEGKAEPAEEMEKLEDEDAQRMKELSKDDSGRIFADLQAKAGDYSKLKTAF